MIIGTDKDGVVRVNGKVREPGSAARSVAVSGLRLVMVGLP